MDVVERARVRNGVKACKVCALHQRCTAPVPFSGSSSPRLVVVGEAPGRQEDDQGEPFIGPAGTVAKNWLRLSGWDVANEVAFVNAVSCFPDRTPATAEVDACQANLLSQLSHLDCRYVLVFGGVAISALTTPAPRVGDVRGICWRQNRLILPRETWCLATWHPAAVLRNRTLDFEAYDDVDYFTAVARRELDPLKIMGRGSFCIKCGTPEKVDYLNDIPYCLRHRPIVTK